MPLSSTSQGSAKIERPFHGEKENLDVVRGLAPEPLFRHFAILSAIPRPSKHEDRVLQYLKDFADAKGFDYASDSVGNLVIRRPSPYDGETVIVQGHIDMVTEKNAASTHDFLNDPIQLRIVKGVDHSSDTQRGDDWLAATHTTLGADNGVGVAAALALLEEPEDALLPTLECLFTVDEETGLTGAQDLDVMALGLSGKTMLNLDTEEWGSLYFGCAGGGGSKLALPVHRGEQSEKKADEGETDPLQSGGLETAAGIWRRATLTVSGLKGGHSGINIHEDRGNALVLLARAFEEVRQQLSFQQLDCGESSSSPSSSSSSSSSLLRERSLKLVTFEGGDKHNAIPREAAATIAVAPSVSQRSLDEAVAAVLQIYRAEFSSEGALSVSLAIHEEEEEEDEKGDARVQKEQHQQEKVEPLSAGTEESLLALLQVLPCGVVKYSHAVPSLVETSSNIASVKLVGPSGLETGEHFEVVCSTRSSLSPALEAVRRSIKTAAQLAGCTSVEQDEAYPGWAPNPSSRVLGMAKRCLGPMLPGGEGDVQVVAIHAGLECGLLGEKMKQGHASPSRPSGTDTSAPGGGGGGGGLDIVSFGPTITGAHSPDERLLLRTVPPFWDLVVGVLGELAKETRK